MVVLFFFGIFLVGLGLVIVFLLNHLLIVFFVRIVVILVGGVSTCSFCVEKVHDLFGLLSRKPLITVLPWRAEQFVGSEPGVGVGGNHEFLIAPASCVEGGSGVRPSEPNC